MKKNKSFSILYIVLFLIIFMAIGMYVGKTLKEDDTLLDIILVLLSYPIYLLSIVCHEFGHMIFGLLSGYTLSSFRVGSFTLVNNNGKLEIKKMNLAGTAGQCIMFPKEGNTKFILYNFGGVLMNIFLFIIFGILLLVVKNDIAKILLFEFGIFNLFGALTNGIPLKSFLNNDMQNIITFKKDPKSLNNYFNALHIQEFLMQGVRLKDIDKKYIYKPESLDTEADVTAMVFYCNQLLDKCDFKKTITEIERVIDNDKIELIHRIVLINDLLYCYIIEDKDISKVMAMKDKTVDGILRQMSSNPSIIRTNYVYALFIDKDEEKANKLMNTFDKVKDTYPSKTDVESEIELIEIAKKKYKEKDQ